MPTPYKILGTYWPVTWRGRKIAHALLQMTERLGYKPLKVKKLRLHKDAVWRSRKLHADVVNHTNPHSEATSWHQDGDLTAGFPLKHGLILWASNTPTELKTPDGQVWRPKPGQVIYVENAEVHHRQPPDACSRRWLFRQRVRS